MNGNFLLTSKTTITVPSGNTDIREAAELFDGQLESLTGQKLEIGNTRTKQSIEFKLNTLANPSLGNEGYSLDINTKHIIILANKPAGLFYGAQTLLQLVPPVKTDGAVAVPCTEITDYPRFGWRGLMLDVSRHFFTKDEVKRYIDQMAKYKLNVFHWHLTDNQGWRIEIKGLPRLTEVGAWRVPREGKFWTFAPPEPGEKATDGGYYTQEDIKEVVRYAQERFVTIVPEIDVPGHSLAFIAAYPEASCTQLPYQVNAGFPHGDEDLVLCPGNEDNFKKLEIIFSEVAALFPGKYIHIGGDEANKDYWKKCSKCQKRIADEGLKNEAELQSYFVKRLEKILHSNGKKLIGWDEILEGGLSPDATVMSWRGVDGGVTASKLGHYVIMSPGETCYINSLQGELAIEKVYAGGPTIRLSDLYNYEPIPEGVDPMYILGGQGNLWTEFVTSHRLAEYMTWPRTLAISEVFWSPKEKRNWDVFVPRMEAQLPRFNQAKVNYAPSVYDPSIIPVRDKDGKLQLKFSTEIKDLDVFYTFNFSFPDEYALKYDHKPIDIPKGASEIWAICYRNGKPIGRLLIITLDELKQRVSP